MKSSDFNEILKFKYRDGEDPQKIKRRRMLDRAFYLCAAVLLIVAIIFNVIWAHGDLKNGNNGMGVMDPWSTPDPNEEIRFSVVDRSSGVKQMSVDEKRINQPSIYGHEILFSAGSNNLASAVFENLYLFDAVTGKAEKIATTKLKDGEIFETYLSKRWIVWVDTDHKGKNVIYKMNREEINGIKANTVSVVQEAENHMPRLGLYGDYLVWMEQVTNSEDKLYFVDLTTDENMAIRLFENTNYAVSTPFIYKNTVIWAEQDTDRPADDVSAIYSIVFEDLGASGDEETEEDTGELVPYAFKTGTYVHKPVCNDDVYVWIDKNNAPDSKLYYAYRDGSKPPVAFWDNVTQYSIGEDFIVFVSNQIVYAYYYDADILLQVSESSSSAILPQAFGTLVVWEDKSSSGDDVFKYNIMG